MKMLVLLKQLGLEGFIKEFSSSRNHFLIVESGRTIDVLYGVLILQNAFNYLCLSTLNHYVPSYLSITRAPTLYQRDPTVPKKHRHNSRKPLCASLERNSC